ncbi:MAG: phosphatidylglycerophosphatase A family protein [Gammaproteobacteria bacterium]
MPVPGGRLSPRAVFRDPVHILAFGGGAGLSPRAPGTLGTLVALIFERAAHVLAIELRIALTAAILAAGVWICGESARRLGEHDHPGIVWDEIGGYFLLMLVAPPGWGWAIAGFVTFRLFDILKPWPIRDIDHRMSGGAGIMLDDALAAVYAAIVLVGLQWLTGR